MSDDATATAAPVEQTEKPTASASSDAPAVEPPSESTEAPAESGEAKESKQDDPVPQTNGASAPKKDNKRKSTGGVPEHKNKKLNRKASKTDLNLDIQPGELWLAVMKGYKNWPCIICDEEMLPESLLSKRPVSAKRPDGSYRPDFLAGGKNARDRRYPIMFLGTNEFAWHVNTDLRAITPEDCKQTLEDNAKKPMQPKTLLGAFEVASEGHDLAYFKAMLAEHEEQALAAQQAREEEEQKKLEAAAKKGKDEEMPDADGEDKPKKEKKRKAPKEEELGEDGKPLKTPKKIKIKTKNPEDEKTSAADSASKPKKVKKKIEKEEKADKTVAPASPVKPVVPETPEEASEKMQKTILFLRHRLQKGFLSRDKPPEDGEMPAMHQHMKTLENYNDLDGSIIRSTKINKVLKAIIKLGTIPREHEFQFKKRSQDILTSWGKQLDEAGAGTPAVATPAAAPATNGVNGEENKDGELNSATVVTDLKKDDATDAASAPTEEAKKTDEPATSVEPTVA